MEYLEVALDVPQETAEAVAFLLWRHGSGGAVLEDGPDGGPAGRALVRAFFPADGEGRARLEAVRAALRAFPASFPHLGLPADRPWWGERVGVVREEDWAEAWKAYYKPVRCGRRLAVAPTWERYDARPGEVVVRLDPGMAFGTGTHPSTALCLEFLDGSAPGDGRPSAPDVAGAAVLDVGTGSGILAIAAALLGAGRVVALDVDPVAVRVAEENARANGVEGRVRVRRGEVAGEPDAAYDLVLANITAGVLRELAPDLARVLRPGGTLVLSGIVAPERGRVEEAFRARGLTPAGAAEREGWVLLAFRRP